MKRTAIVIDDEFYAREELKFLLEENNIVVVGEAANAIEGMNCLQETEPDLVFLDIDMPGINGFDMLSMTDKVDPTRVIFVTAYGEHAVRAFEENALDYLLKPVSNERLQKALRNPFMPSQQDDEPAESSTERISCEFAGTTYLLDASTVIYAHIDVAGTVYLHTDDGKTYHKDTSLKELEQMLPDMIRCHRQHLVKSSAIQSFRSDGNYCGTLTLPANTHVPVSRRFMKTLKQRFGHQLSQQSSNM